MIMGENSNISWTDHTFNPWEGCTKVSDGCSKCYAESLNHRYGKDNWGKGKPRRRTSEANWKKPLRWHSEAFALTCGDCDPCIGGRPDRCAISPQHRPRVFSASLADWLDDEVPIEWLADFLTLIHDTPNLDWLCLSKRPEKWNIRIREARNFLTKGGCAETALWLNDWLPTPATSGVYERGRQATSDHHGMPGDPPANVWIGTSIENNDVLRKRHKALMAIPARVHFWSAEPLLSELEDARVAWIADGIPQWVIAGGESGSGHREMKLEWMETIYAQCKAAGVPFFCKQDCGPRPGMQGRIPDAIWNTKEFPI